MMDFKNSDVLPDKATKLGISESDTRQEDKQLLVMLNGPKRYIVRERR